VPALASMRVDVHENNFARALINSTRLTSEETLRRRLVERELGHLVQDFIDRWPDASRVTGTTSASAYTAAHEFCDHATGP
jgi:hypothetical protein